MVTVEFKLKARSSFPIDYCQHAQRLARDSTSPCFCSSKLEWTAITSVSHVDVPKQVR